MLIPCQVATWVAMFDLIKHGIINEIGFKKPGEFSHFLLVGTNKIQQSLPEISNANFFKDITEFEFDHFC